MKKRYFDIEALIALFVGVLAYLGRAYAVVIKQWFYYFFSDDFAVMCLLIGYAIAICYKKTATKWIVTFYAIIHFFTLFDDYYDKNHPKREPEILPTRYGNAVMVLIMVIVAAYLHRKWHERKYRRN